MQGYHRATTSTSDIQPWILQEFLGAFSLLRLPLQHLPDEPQKLGLILPFEFPLGILQTRGRNLSSSLPISCGQAISNLFCDLVTSPYRPCQTTAKADPFEFSRGNLLEEGRATRSYEQGGKYCPLCSRLLPWS